jgi:SAM-dependent methyltransferase
MATETRDDWDQRYRTGDTPWDVRRPCEELAGWVESGDLQPTRALELGCGTGTNAVYLASQGFQVTAIDLSLTAIYRAQDLSRERGVEVDFVCGDLTELPAVREPFGFVYDRGCYHAVRRVNLDGYLTTLRRVTGPGTRMLLLAGNSDEQPSGEKSPPRVSEQEIRTELGSLFVIADLRAIRLVMNDGQPGPLFWACRMVKP